MSERHKTKVAAIVVTYNRSELLEHCVTALLNQSMLLDNIIVIDNASNDGTELAFARPLDPRITYVRLPNNRGGAGGFAAGIERALQLHPTWMWMMDDDACPYPNALEELIKIADNPRDIYGSLAVCGEKTSWSTTLIDENRIVELADDIPTRARVSSIPLLGFLVHHDLVREIGLPDADFFIAADDIEYCLRARQAGANITISGNSRIEHPRTMQRAICLLGIRITYLSLAPWKRYYDTRNRLLIARKYHGIRLFTHAIPGTLVRLAVALWLEPGRLQQLHAVAAGIFDGLLGIKGKRHIRWGIAQ